MIDLEIIAFDLKGCEVAQSAGADRIELCANPHLGGTTPTRKLIKSARSILDIPIHVMIRPKGGGFCYSDQELYVMEESIQFCKLNNVEGVVFGILKNDNYLDVGNNKRLLQHCDGISTTFHRAFDEIAHPFTALENIITLGFDRILTSGLHNTAQEGREVIKRLAKQAKARIKIMPGSGIKSENLKALHKYLSTSEYHSSAKILDKNGMYLGVNSNEVLLMKNILTYL